MSKITSSPSSQTQILQLVNDFPEPKTGNKFTWADLIGSADAGVIAQQAKLRRHQVPELWLLGLERRVGFL